MSKKIRFTIFTILIGGALLLALLSGVVFADSDCEITFGWGMHDTILCGVVSLLENQQVIIENQEQIIDKIDWNNCAISYKETRSYQYKDWSHVNRYSEIVEKCGERP